MSSQYTLKISPEQAKETPMVDLAFLILKAANTPFYYRDLMMEIAKVKGIPEESIKDVIAQIYTEINIDGRFACVGKNLWGLKRWYPVEKTEDPVGNASRPRIINDEDDDDLDDEVFEEESYEKSYDDEDDAESFDEDDSEEEDIDEDAEIEDEDMDEDFSGDLDEDDDIKGDDDSIGDDDDDSDDEDDDFDDLDDEEDDK